MNLPTTRFCLRCLTPGLLWFAQGLLLSMPLRAATPGNDAGPRLLQAQLPPGVTLRQADCEHLVRAVRVATLAHHHEAAVILSAALTKGADTSARAPWAKPDCTCAVRIFHAAVAAAPDHASELLETAEALCPDCADALTAVLQHLEDKNVVADPGDAAGRHGANAGNGNGAGPGSIGDPGDPGDPGAHNPGDPGDPSADLTARDFNGLDLQAGSGEDPGAYHSGLGAGANFPGAPGFAGSTPGTGFALPPPVAPAVTSAVNR